MGPGRAGWGGATFIRAGSLIRGPSHPHLHGSGAVVTMECVEKLIRKDMVDPVNGEKLTDRDIIVLQRVSTDPCPGLALKAPPLLHAPSLLAPPSPERPASSAPRPRGPTCLHGGLVPTSPGRHRLRGLRREAAG